MLNQDQIEIARTIVAAELFQDADKIQQDSRIVEDLGMDSLDTIDILIQLEEEFDIDMDDDHFATLTTFGDVCAYVGELVAAKEAK